MVLCYWLYCKGPTLVTALPRVHYPHLGRQNPLMPVKCAKFTIQVTLAETEVVLEMACSHKQQGARDIGAL